MAPAAAGPGFADLRQRLLSGLAMAAAAIAPLLVGGALMTLFVAAIVAAAGWEHRRVTLTGGPRVAETDARLYGAALAAAAVTAGFLGAGAALAVLAAGLLGFALADARRGAEPHWGWGAAGFVAWGLAATSFVLLRDIPGYGLQTALWIGGVVIATDVGAYFAGRLIGGPKLWPRVSPKKTWAGLGGAVALSALVGAGFAAASGAAVWQVVCVSAIAALVAQGGDLAESAFKRRFGVKDSSGLIPGHGGVLDRIDGLAAATLVAAAVTALRGRAVFSW